MQLPDRLPPRGRFTALYAWLNQLREHVQSLRPAESLNTLTSHTAIGVTRQSAGEAPEVEEGVTVTQYKITSLPLSFPTNSHDVIFAKTWDGTTLGDTTITIAIPFRLRRTGWHGQTIVYPDGESILYTYNSLQFQRRTATLSGQTENQRIIPVYRVGDLIYATEPENGTAVTVSGTDITWLDVNVDGRSWARY